MMPTGRQGETSGLRKWRRHSLYRLIFDLLRRRSPEQLPDARRRGILQVAIHSQPDGDARSASRRRAYTRNTKNYGIIIRLKTTNYQMCNSLRAIERNKNWQERVKNILVATKKRRKSVRFASLLTHCFEPVELGHYCSERRASFSSALMRGFRVEPSKARRRLH
jgi:hypothetical protein